VRRHQFRVLNEQNARHRSGFVFVHDDSTCDLSCIEAVPVEQIDPNRARQGIDTYQKMLATAGDEATSVKAQIGLEVHEAMVCADVFEKCVSHTRRDSCTRLARNEKISQSSI
jgi:F0F1-type ATP synthase epsilon subunit